MINLIAFKLAKYIRILRIETYRFLGRLEGAAYRRAFQYLYTLSKEEASKKLEELKNDRKRA